MEIYQQRCKYLGRKGLKKLKRGYGGGFGFGDYDSGKRGFGGATFDHGFGNSFSTMKMKRFGLGLSGWRNLNWY